MDEVEVLFRAASPARWVIRKASFSCSRERALSSRTAAGPYSASPSMIAASGGPRGSIFEASSRTFVCWLFLSISEDISEPMLYLLNSAVGERNLHRPALPELSAESSMSITVSPLTEQMILSPSILPRILFQSPGW